VQLDQVTDRIRNFLIGHFPLARQVGNEDRLLGNGVIDSLGVLEIVTFLEQEFNISVGDDDLLPENFQSISQLTAFVERKLSAAPPAQ
jgi:acyl carrier protein